MGTATCAISVCVRVWAILSGLLAGHSMPEGRESAPDGAHEKRPAARRGVGARQTLCRRPARGRQRGQRAGERTAEQVCGHERGGVLGQIGRAHLQKRRDGSQTAHDAVPCRAAQVAAGQPKQRQRRRLPKPAACHGQRTAQDQRHKADEEPACRPYQRGGAGAKAGKHRHACEPQQQVGAHAEQAVFRPQAVAGQCDGECLQRDGYAGRHGDGELRKHRNQRRAQRGAQQVGQAMAHGTIPPFGRLSGYGCVAGRTRRIQRALRTLTSPEESVSCVPSG